MRTPGVNAGATGPASAADRPQSPRERLRLRLRPPPGIDRPAPGAPRHVAAHDARPGERRDRTRERRGPSVAPPPGRPPRRQRHARRPGAPLRDATPTGGARSSSSSRRRRTPPRGTASRSRDGARSRAGPSISGTGLSGIVTGKGDSGHYRVAFSGTPLEEALPRVGTTPLPPYIHREGGVADARDAEDYQTVYAREPGAIAAPTAGLHLSAELLEALRVRGVERRLRDAPRRDRHVQAGEGRSGRGAPDGPGAGRRSRGNGRGDPAGEGGRDGGSSPSGRRA